MLEVPVSSHYRRAGSSLGKASVGVTENNKKNPQ